MIAATFPLLGLVFVFFIILPAAALLAKIVLVALERDEVGGPFHGLSLRYVVLTGSSVLPLGWLVSAGLLQAANEQSALACLFDHGGAAYCLEPVFFVLLLIVPTLVTLLSVARRCRQPKCSKSEAAEFLRFRVAGVVESMSGLACLRDRVVVTDEPGCAVVTHGWLKPRVFIGTGFGARISDDMLASSLSHEVEHVRSFDPLRYGALQLALALNPFGRRLLSSHAARWQIAREAHCDREAVIRGADALALAEAILCAARPSQHEVALGAKDTDVLKVRVGMLVAFAERIPARCCHLAPPALPLTLCLLVAIVLLPHGTGTAALDVLHTLSERSLGWF